MVQEVILNGRPHDLDYEPSLKVGTQQDRTPIEINGKMVHGVSINGYDYPPADSGCVLYYPGLPGYGSTIWDRSNQGNNGTIIGATWVRLPSGLWVLSFDGDDYVSRSVANFRSGDSQGSIIVWFKTSTADTDMTFVCSADEGTDTSYLLFSISSVTNGVQIFTQNAGGAPGAYRGATVVTDGAWHHVALISNGTTWSAILDNANEALIGVLGHNNGDWFGDITLRDNLTIGVRKRTGFDRYFIGSIALVRIFNSALSASKIFNIFHQERHLFGV